MHDSLKVATEVMNGIPDIGVRLSIAIIGGIVILVGAFLVLARIAQADSDAGL